MAWPHFFLAGAVLYTDVGKNRKTHWYEAVTSVLHFPFWEEVSQNCFVFDAVNGQIAGSLPEKLRF